MRGMMSRTRLLRLIVCIVVPAVALWAWSASPVLGQDADALQAEAAPDAEADPTTESAEAPEQIQSWLRDQLPEVLKEGGFIGVEYWQWLGLFILVLTGLVLDLIVRMLLRLVTVRIMLHQKAEADRKVVIKAMRPIGGLAAAVLWVLVLRMDVLVLPAEIQRILLGAAKVFAALVGTLAAWRITDLVSDILAAKAARTETKIDDVVVPLVRKTIKIFIVIFGSIYVADSLQFNIWPVVASLGLGSLAFAFAAKDTVENFFGSVAVLLDRPFHIGDWVVVGDTEGIVEEIGFRSTRIRTFYNSLVTVPNATLVRATVDNYGARRYRRWKTYVGVQYDTPPDKLVAFCEGIRELVRCHPYTRKDYFQVYLNEFGPSSLNILLYIFHEVPDWSTELRERERMFLDIVRLADQLGVHFAFPTQTIHLYQEQHDQPHAPAASPGAEAEDDAARRGVRTVQQLIASQPWQQDKPGPVTFTDGPTRIDDKGDTPDRVDTESRET